MGLLQPRAASVSRSTYVATTVLLVLWIITFGAIIVYLVRRLRKGGSRFERPVIIDHSASYGSTAPHVPPDPIRRTEDLSRRTPTASPIRNPVPAALSSTVARQQSLLARQPSQAAMFARLQAMPLGSDTTDMSNETADPPRETVNASYMAMLAQRGIDARDHALVGSDDSTDAGAGAESYALRVRGLVVGGLSAGMEMEPARFLGRGGHGRAMTYG